MRFSKIRLKSLKFNNLPLSADLIDRLHTNFPSVHTPTPAQSELISKISNGFDVLLKAETGDGKYVLVFYSDIAHNSLQISRVAAFALITAATHSYNRKYKQKNHIRPTLLWKELR